MKQFVSWLTRPYHGSNRVSLAIRKRLENLPFRQVLGVNLAGAAFAAAVVVPQINDVAANLEIANETKQTVVEVAPIESAYQWPMSRFELSQRFRLGHPAVDLTDPKGTPVYSIANGEVTRIAAQPWGYGKHLFVKHNDAVQSLYAHLSTISVEEGQRITRQTKIGEVGSTGWSTGNHLHLEIYQDGTPVNPLEVLPEIK